MRRILFLPLLIVLGLLTGCAPTAATSQPQAASPTQASGSSEVKPAQATRAPLPTQPLPAPTQAALPTQTAAFLPTAAPVLPEAAPTEVIEGRLVEIEWPGSMRLGDSDIVRLALVPDKDGYQIETEFPEHQLQTQSVPIERPAGYQLFALAVLDGVAFEISPSGEQEHLLPLGESVTWRWTVRPAHAGQHSLSISLWLRWIPDVSHSGPRREALAFSRAMLVQVDAFLGLTRSQAAAAGLLSLFLSGGLGLFALIVRPPRTGRSVGSGRAFIEIRHPNPQLKLEPPPGMRLEIEESSLLRALFNRYGRLVLQSEFLSGYSGARTFLALPLRPDGRADAHTIVKIGPLASIQREFDNYESYVKDSLPPVTARIQHAPVRTRGGKQAALQYTFIGEAARQPVSLRQALLREPDPALLFKLFETFGPNWWLQRTPYVFRASLEYDRLLPPHYLLEPVSQPASRPTMAINEQTPPETLDLQPEDVVLVRRFSQCELRADGHSFTLRGSLAGKAALRLRWLGEKPPHNSLARVVAGRNRLMAQLVSGFELGGLPDPLQSLPGWLAQIVMGTRSIIHGDLNLENVLVGPGSFVWLIDFAQTRPGHPLFDFARLRAELIAQVLAPQMEKPLMVIDLLRAGNPLLNAVEQIEARCLFNPDQPAEAALANTLASLGALKFGNLDEKARRCLYIAAAYSGSQIQA